MQITSHTTLPTHLLSVLVALALISFASPGHAIDLDTAVREAGRDGQEWLVYTVEADADQHFVCCHVWERGNVRTATCRPEGNRDSWTVTGHEAAPESNHLLKVYLGVENGRVERLRAYSAGCHVETTWSVTELQGVTEQESLSLLGGLVLESDGRGRRRDDRRDHAMAAIAEHRASAAARTLAGLYDDGEDSELRELSLFWLSQTGDASAEDVLFGAIRNDPEDDVREHAVFALSQLPAGRGVDGLVQAMRITDEDDIQRMALFWLAESQDPRAMELIAKILE